jgi:hypothetical protein
MIHFLPIKYSPDGQNWVDAKVSVLHGADNTQWMLYNANNDIIDSTNLRLEGQITANFVEE